MKATFLAGDVLADWAVGPELDALLNRTYDLWQAGDERTMVVDVADVAENDDNEIEIYLRRSPKGREGVADGWRVLAPRAELEAGIIARASRHEADGDDALVWESEAWWRALRIAGRWYVESYSILGGSSFDGPALALARNGEVLEAPFPRYVRERVEEGQLDAPETWRRDYAEPARRHLRVVLQAALAAHPEPAAAV